MRGFEDMLHKMSGKRITRWILFGAGMLASVEAGHLFFIERLAAGAACLCMTAVFLYYAMREHQVCEAPFTGAADGAAMAELALFAAELAVNGLKGIGRTIPPSSKEVSQMEDRLNEMLDRLDVPLGRRAGLKEEFDKIKGKVRRNEGGIALIRSSRL